VTAYKPRGGEYFQTMFLQQCIIQNRHGVHTDTLWVVWM